MDRHRPLRAATTPSASDIAQRPAGPSCRCPPPPFTGRRARQAANIRIQACACTGAPQRHAPTRSDRAQAASLEHHGGWHAAPAPCALSNGRAHPQGALRWLQLSLVSDEVIGGVSWIPRNFDDLMRCAVFSCAWFLVLGSPWSCHIHFCTKSSPSWMCCDHLNHPA